MFSSLHLVLTLNCLLVSPRTAMVLRRSWICLYKQIQLSSMYKDGHWWHWLASVQLPILFFKKSSSIFCVPIVFNSSPCILSLSFCCWLFLFGRSNNSARFSIANFSIAWSGSDEHCILPTTAVLSILPVMLQALSLPWTPCWMFVGFYPSRFFSFFCSAFSTLNYFFFCSVLRAQYSRKGNVRLKQVLGLLIVSKELFPGF